MKLYVIELQFAGQIWQLLGKSRQSDTVAVVTATQHKSPVSYFVHIFNIGSSFVLYFVNWWTKKLSFLFGFFAALGYIWLPYCQRTSKTDDLVGLLWYVDREMVKKRSVELVCQVYSQVYTALTAAGSGYSDIPTIAPRTPDQVVKLLC